MFIISSLVRTSDSLKMTRAACTTEQSSFWGCQELNSSLLGYLINKEGL